ncbi:hypothetical protein Anapl_06927 [Anas platyrhynchos]|uniref:Uncharacterized protein n=1 Tax=Anas platyrhynchos TaxID=8839 RepID=R0LYM5_ANAPL|nr:hypothetical protein Anapl_06927 [Anas platyrhynchos]
MGEQRLQSFEDDQNDQPGLQDLAGSSQKDAVKRATSQCSLPEYDWLAGENGSKEAIEMLCHKSLADNTDAIWQEEDQPQSQIASDLLKVMQGTAGEPR